MCAGPDALRRIGQGCWLLARMDGSKGTEEHYCKTSSGENGAQGKGADLEDHYCMA